jgi:DNA invertase Pin-like site-specific DNA recombinase
VNRPIRAALYTRVSTRAQADKNGSAYQREALERMAEARGWSVVRVSAVSPSPPPCIQRV